MNFITVTIYQRAYLWNLSNKQGRRLFIFFNTKCPACISTDSSGRMVSPRSCCPPSNDKTMPAPTLPINRPRQVSRNPEGVQVSLPTPNQPACAAARGQPRPRESGCMGPSQTPRLACLETWPGSSSWGHRNEWGLEGQERSGVTTLNISNESHLRDYAFSF